MRSNKREASASKAQRNCSDTGWSNAPCRTRRGQPNQKLHSAKWLELHSKQSTRPDSNLLDLGLLHGMKTAADAMKGDGRNIDTCIQRMLEAFQAYDSDRIEIVWGVLFEV